MRNDPHVRINIELAAAWGMARNCITRHWRALLAAWVLTNLAASLAYIVLYPPWTGAAAAEAVDSFRYAVYVVTTSLVGAVGFIFVVLLARASAAGEERYDYGSLLDESVRRLGRYIITAVLCFLRVLLWGLMALPLLMVFGLLGVGAAAGVGTATLLYSAPVMVFMALAFVRFGWGLYFTVINEDPPLFAMYHGQSMYLNNKRTTWILAAAVFLVPALLPLIDIYDVARLGEYLHPAAYISSAWSFVASVFATMVVVHTTGVQNSTDTDAGADAPTDDGR